MGGNMFGFSITWQNYQVAHFHGKHLTYIDSTFDVGNTTCIYLKKSEITIVFYNPGPNRMFGFSFEYLVRVVTQWHSL